jgi:hypothetical protein
MQPNTITLNVDPLNDGNPAPELYERFEEFQNRSVYIGANHVPELRDQLALYRTFPNKSGNFKGVLKTTTKVTRDFVVPGVDSGTTLTVPGIIETSYSLPVGLTEAQIVEIRQASVALQDLDSVMTELNHKQMV